MLIDLNPQSACRFALARCDITPPVGIYHRMWGAATHDRSEGVHRPLTATALYFTPAAPAENPDDRFLLVALDLCIMCREELDPIVERIIEATGLKPTQVSVTFGHTHAVGRMSPDRFELPGGELIPSYLESLGNRVAEASATCIKGAEEARIDYGESHCNLAANRDLWDPDSGQFVCGTNPDGPADDRVVVARVSRPDGSLVATVVNYACHPTSLAWENRLLSPDFPGAMRELVELATEAPCVFIQGASGELGPRIGFSGDTDVADRNGRQLGHAALSAIESLPPPGTDLAYTGAVESGALIGTWTEQALDPQRELEVRLWIRRHVCLELPYRSDLPSVKELESDLTRWSALESAGENAAGTARLNPRAEAEKAKRFLERRRSLPAGSTYPYPIHLLRVGDAVWISVQGEPYSLLQTELRKRFPKLTLVIASVSGNWSPAYLPPVDAYGSGRYQDRIAVLAKGSLETLIDRITGMILETMPH